MTHRTLNWLLACLIALLMSCTWMLDGPSDMDAARDVAADVIDATTQAQATHIHLHKPSEAACPQ